MANHVEQYTVIYTCQAGVAATANAALAKSFYAVEAAARAADALVSKAGKDHRGITETNTALGKTKTRADDAVKAMADLNAQVQMTGGSFSVSAGHATSFVGSMIKMNLVMGAFHIAVDAVKAMGDGIREARDYAHEASEEFLKITDSMRELSSIVNTAKNPKTPEAIAVDVVEAMLQTGLNEKETNEFKKQYYGSSDAGRRSGNLDNVDEAEFQKFAAETGLRYNVSAKTSGDVAGAVSAFRKFESTEDAKAEIATAYKNLSEGRGEIELLARSSIGIAGSQVNGDDDTRFKSFADLTAVTSGLSVPAKGASSVGTRDEQMKAGLDQLAKSGKFGLNQDMDTMTMLNTIAPHVKAMKNPNAELNTQGVTQRQSRAMIIGGVAQLKVINERLERGQDKAAMVAEAEADNAKMELGETHRKRMASNLLLAQKRRAGIKDAELNIAQDEAKARLNASGVLDSSGYKAMRNFGDATFGRVPQMLGGPTLEQGIILESVLDQLINEQAAKGIIIEKEFPGIRNQGLGTKLGAAFNVDETQLRAALQKYHGDGVMKGLEQRIDKLIELELEKKRQRAGLPANRPVGLPSAPVVVMPVK